MILSDQDIKQMSQGHGNVPLVTPFDLKSLRLSSYDLTIGGEFYSGRDAKTSSISTQKLRPNQTFTIPPHGVCFILSEETISLPHDVSAKVSLRMSLVYRGLVLTSQPPFDPGYCGKVIVMVHNLSSEAHHLQQGTRIATIEFVRVENASPAPSSGTGAQTHRGVSDLMGQLTVPVESSLTKISSQAKKAQSSVRGLIGQLLGFASLLVAIAALPAVFSFKYMDDRQADQARRIELMQKTIDEQATALGDLHSMKDRQAGQARRMASMQKTIDEQTAASKDLYTQFKSVRDGMVVVTSQPDLQARPQTNK